MTVGVVVLGHGSTASRLLEAANGILAEGMLHKVVAIDAGLGDTPKLSAEVYETIKRLDDGQGVVVLIDLPGASPCQCVQREGDGHEVVVLSGLNLAMLLKVAAVDRDQTSATHLVEACADSAQRSVRISVRLKREEAQT